MKTIRWGIVGPGIIANRFAAAMQNVEGAELRAVAARSPEKGKAFAEKYGIPLAFDGYESMSVSDEIDAVYIATPHPFHKPCAELFLQAGKHVLCEKPLCVNAAQAVELQKCAAENGVFLMEAMWTRFLPAVQEACAIAASGAIGRIKGLRADFCYASTPEEEAKIFDHTMAGGSLLDVGVYGLHMAALVFGHEPERIQANAWVRGGVDCHTAILLQYADGAIAEISSAIGLEKPDSAYLYGTKGRIYLPHFYGAEELFVTVDGKEEHLSRPFVGNGFEEEITEVCRCIRDGKTESDILPLSESIAVIKQMDHIRKQLGIRYPLEGEKELFEES